jgi:hypothetical protein
MNDGMPAMKEASAETGSGGTSYGAPTATDVGWHAAFEKCPRPAKIGGGHVFEGCSWGFSGSRQ